MTVKGPAITDKGIEFCKLKDFLKIKVEGLKDCRMVNFRRTACVTSATACIPRRREPALDLESLG